MRHRTLCVLTLAPYFSTIYLVHLSANLIDLYEINPNTTSPSLKHVASRSLLPDHLTTSSRQFRGDTLLLTPPTPAHPSPYALFATTRGSTSATRGWLSIFALDDNGYFLNEQKDANGHPTEVVIRHETGSSGGKANAIDLLTKRKVPPFKPKYREDDPDGMRDDIDEAQVPDENDNNDFYTRPHKQTYLNSPFKSTSKSAAEVEANIEGDAEAWKEQDQGVWILLTDDDETTAASSDVYSAHGGVKVLEWDGWGGQGVHVVAEWPEPTNDSPDFMYESEEGKEKEGEGKDGGAITQGETPGRGEAKDSEDKSKGEMGEGNKVPEKMLGGSHAIWLV